MAPEKTDVSECSDSPTIAGATGTADAVNTSTVSVDSTNGEHDPYFEPVVTLPEVTTKTLEEDEVEMYKGRCKMFRFVHDKEEGGSWKERGTGDVKLLRHEEKGTVRLLMRQEKTLKVRANHYITPYMKLRPNCGSDRAFVWYVMFDFADEETKGEMFAIKFANADHARAFKDSFEEGITYVTSTIVADCQDLAETLAAVRAQAADDEEDIEEEDEGNEGDENKENEGDEDKENEGDKDKENEGDEDKENVGDKETKTAADSKTTLATGDEIAASLEKLKVDECSIGANQAEETTTS